MLHLGVEVLKVFAKSVYLVLIARFLMEGTSQYIGIGLHLEPNS